MEKEKKEMSLKEKVDLLYNQSDTIQTKKFRIPRKGKLSRSKVKKGFTTVMRVDDNGNVDFEKQRIDNSTFRLSTKDYHVTDEKDILSYKGKPFIIQPTKKLNPYNPLTGEKNPLTGENETYGQPYIMARMLGDTIKIKSGNAKGLLWVIGLGFAIYIGYSIFKGGI